MNYKEARAVFNSPELNVFVYPALQMLEIKANGFVPSAIYRKGLTIATETAIEQKIMYWLVNNKTGGIVTPTDQIWANEVNAPYLGLHSSIIKMAFIEPNDVQSRMILEDMMDKAIEFFPFEMQFFAEVKDAIMWFRDEDTTSNF